MEAVISSLDAVNETAKQFIKALGGRKIFAFYGKMGAGKTTFIKAICRELGVTDVINSPTFAIVNEYTASSPLLPPDNQTIYHFDFYRIKKIDEFFEIGGEEYFESGSLCFIECPELIETVLPQDTVHVNIEERADGSRHVTCF